MSGTGTDKAEPLKRYAFWFSLVGALAAVGLFFLFLEERKSTWESDEKFHAWEDLTAIKARLESEIYARIYHTRSMAAYVSLHPELSVDEFENLAAELIRDDRVVNTMTIAPDGVIRAVYPRNGHEEAIGLDLMAHPERKKIVEKTIRTGKTFIAGPVELVEGGKALISYTPVFDKTGTEPKFWGMTDISIRFDRFLSEAGLDPASPSLEDGALALKGKDGFGKKGDLFWGKEEVFGQGSVEVVVALPDGYWILAKNLKLGWARFVGQNLFFCLVATFAVLLMVALASMVIRSICRVRASRQRLALLNRDKNRLLSIIGHDVRAPLSGASGLLSELEVANDRFSEEDRESVSMVHASVEDAMLLLENLLEWVKNRDSEPLLRMENLSLDREVDAVIGSFSLAAARKSVAVRKSVEPETTVRFDQRALRTVLRNLIGNGIKFSRTGGVLEVSARSEGTSSVEITISDQGVGMNEERISEILNRDQLKSEKGTAAEQGTGLGLFLCRQLLHMGGSGMEIRSRPEKGTVVCFRLPRGD